MRRLQTVDYLNVCMYFYGHLSETLSKIFIIDLTLPYLTLPYLTLPYLLHTDIEH